MDMAFSKYRMAFGSEYSGNGRHFWDLRDVKDYAKEQGATHLTILDSAASVQRPKVHAFQLLEGKWTNVRLVNG